MMNTRKKKKKQLLRMSDGQSQRLRSINYKNDLGYKQGGGDNPFSLLCKDAEVRGNSLPQEGGAVWDTGEGGVK